MSKRREFSAAVYTEIVDRATRDNGKGLRTVYCEECGLPAKVWHVDHTNPDALQVDKSRKLTADDGRVLCAGSSETCHGKKTAADQKIIAKAKRNDANAHGYRRAGRQPKIKSPPLPTTPKAAARAINAGSRIGVPPVRMPQGFVSAGDSRS